MVGLTWTGRTEPGPVAVPSVHTLSVHGAPSASGDLLLQGDNLAALSWLLDQGWGGTVRLIYIDPPFASGADYAQRIEPRGAGASGTRKLTKVQYTDTLSRDRFLQFLYERLVLLRDLLAPDGSLVLHLDAHIHYLARALLDEVFGADHFVNEIVWHYPDNFQGNVRGFANNHNTLTWYRRGDRCVANPVRVPLPKPVKRDRRVWDKALKKVVAARDADGRILYDTYTDKKADDVWRIGQSSVSKRRSKEHCGYPTQKPLALLDRVVQMGSNPGDRVLDAFVGSGTTAVSAQRLGRRWCGIDANPAAIAVTEQRLAVAAPGAAWTVMGVGDAAVVGDGRAAIAVERSGGGARVSIQTFDSPALRANLGLDDAEDWRRLVDCVQIDPDHDGGVFASRLTDAPGRRSELVQGVYELERAGPVVAVRILDLVGQPVVVTGS